MSEETLLSQQNNTQGSQDLGESSRVSSILIGILLIVAVFLAFNFFQSTPENNNDVANNSEPTPVLSEGTGDADGSGTDNAGMYTVKSGDTLWSIAETQLNDGFLWKEIADANNISNSSELNVGTQLIIPTLDNEGSTNGDLDIVTPTKAPEVTETPAPTPTIAIVEATPTPQVSGSITENPVAVDQVYVVVAGDTLWDIAVTYYGDGTQWHKIFDDSRNDVSMYTPQHGPTYPLIHAGNVIIVPGVVQQGT